MESWNQEYLRWLRSPALDGDSRQELGAIEGDGEKIKEWFYAPLEFGTAGLRGIMRPGINGMNVYTVRQATQGLASELLASGEGAAARGVVIAFDSRHNSLKFAREAARVLRANGIKVYIFDDIRPTPELSYAVRKLGCAAGINVTASHNPKEYNGYKVYGGDGAQLSPELADAVSARIAEVDVLSGALTCDYDEAVGGGGIVIVGQELDRAYLAEVRAQSARPEALRGAPGFKIVYTPLHGAGYKLVPEILKLSGLPELLIVREQGSPDGDFPTVKHPNPEYAEAFVLGKELAEKHGASLVIATDPDCDRVGVSAKGADGEYKTITGNQMGAILLDYIIEARREAGKLPANACAVKTIVTTNLIDKICAANGVGLVSVLTGFKFIGEKIKEFEESGSRTYIFGFEESYGYLAGTYARDKDAVVASMLIAEMAAYYRARRGIGLSEALEGLYKKYGYYAESTANIYMEGPDGAERIASLTRALRAAPPAAFGGAAVTRARDYLAGRVTRPGSAEVEPTGLPKSDVLYYELADGCDVIVRPSGTEPKIKIYVLARGSSAEGAARRCAELAEAAKAETLRGG